MRWPRCRGMASGSISPPTVRANSRSGVCLQKAEKRCNGRTGADGSRLNRPMAVISISPNSPQPVGPAFWRMPAAGGEETQVLESLLAFSFDVNKGGIYYADRPGFDGLVPMYSHSFATGRKTQIADSSLRGGGSGLAVSPDGTTLLDGRSTEIGTDLMVYLPWLPGPPRRLLTLSAFATTAVATERALSS